MSASSNAPKKPDKQPEKSSQGNQQTSKLLPVDGTPKDATGLKYRHRRWWWLRLLSVLVLLLILIAVTLIYMMGTDEGTAFLIEKIDQETGLTLKYGDGNFRDGIWLTDVDIPASPEMDIQIDKAYVKIGWRAIFAKEIHLRDADIDNIRIISHTPPSGQPFSYTKIDMPVNLRLDHASIDRFTFEKPTIVTQVFSEIEANSLKWLGTKLSVKQGKLTYGYQSGNSGNSDNKEYTIGQLDKLSGHIRFEQDYPITAKAKVNIHSISQHYFDDIDLKATGSLKNLHGKLKSQYNQHKITANLDIQPMTSDIPMTATIKAHQVSIPYATDYDIQLKQTTIDMAGTWKQLTFNIDSELSAHHIPTGHYQGQVTYHTLQENLEIQQLTAKTDKGTVNANGLLDWHKSGHFWMDTHLSSHNYRLDTVVPKEWADYRGYLPKTLNGTLDFKYQHKNAQGYMQIDTKLAQTQAETVTASIIRQLTAEQTDEQTAKQVRSQSPLHDTSEQDTSSLHDTSSSSKKSSFPTPKPIPYHITANWKNLYRKIDSDLDVHHLGIIDSDHGTAELRIEGNQLEVTAKAQLNQLNAAPKGEYQIELERVGNQLTIHDLLYQGDVGDLTGSGSVTIPTGDDPILWSLSGHTNGFRPIKYNASIPVELVVGDFSLDDRMWFDTNNINDTNANSAKVTAGKTAKHGKAENLQHHQLTIHHANVHTVLSNQSQQKIALDGKGTTLLTLDDNGLTYFDTEYRGKIDNSQLPKGQYHLQAKGNASDIVLDKLDYQGESGQLAGAGKIILNTDDAGSRIGWQLKTTLNNFDFGYLSAETPAVINGLLDTTGEWLTPNLPPPPASDLTADKPTSASGGLLSELTALAIKFDGDVQAGEKLAGKLPSGKLAIDAKLNPNLLNPTLNTTGNTTSHTQKNSKQKHSYQSDKKDRKKEDKKEAKKDSNKTNIIVNRLYHQGEAGLIEGMGKLNLTHHPLRDRYQWQLTATMKNFNLGYFSKDIASTLTGDIDTKGNWQTANSHPNLHPPVITDAKLNTPKSSISNNPLINLTDFAIDLDAEVKTDKLPSGHLSINASSDNKQSITINRFRHQGEAGFFDTKGSIKLADGYQWQLTSEMKDFNLGYFANNIDSKMTGKVNTEGSWGKQQQRIDISDMNLTGVLKNQPLTLTGQLSTQLKLPKDLTTIINRLKKSNRNQQYQQVNQLIDTLELNDLQARWGDNSLTAKGKLDSHSDKHNDDTQQRLQATVNINSLDKLYTPLKGKLFGGISLSPTTPTTHMSLPILYVDLVGKNIALPNLQLKNGHIQGKIVDFADSHSQLSIVAEQLVTGSQRIDTLNALLVGTKDKHQLNLTLANNELSISGTMAGGLTSGLNNQGHHWQGILSQGQITSDKIRLSQRQASELDIDIANSQFQMASHCWQATHALTHALKKSGSNSINSINPNVRKNTRTNKGNLCLTDTLLVSQDMGKINLALQNIDTSVFAFFLPNELDWRATLNGSANLDWHKGQKPNIDAKIYSDNGKIALKQEDIYQYATDSDAHHFVPYNRISLIAVSTDEGLKLRTDIASENKGKGYADIVINPFTQGKPISGKLALTDLNLSLFKPLFPGLRILEGKGSLDADVAGKLTKPLINGQFKLTDGRMAVVGLPIDISKVNTTATIHGTHAKLEGGFYSGEGKGELSGTLDWKNTLQAKVGIKGQQLNVSQPPLLSANINPDINLILRPSEKYVEIKGAVSVPSATIRPPEANEDIIQKSADVNLFDLRQDSSVVDQVLAITQPWSINADIGVDLGEEVVFRGFGAELPLAGALVVKQRNQGTLQGKGVVQVSRASTVDAFGQNLHLKYAQFRINGAIDRPLLSIEADKQIEGSTVGFRVKGDIINPDIRVFNNAGLTEQQAMNALVTGRLYSEASNQVSEEGFRSEVSNNLAAAGLSVGLNSTRSITNQIGRAVGLQSLALSASGDSNDTHVNVTGYLTPDLYIRYGIGVFNAQSELSLRYQLTKRLYIEAISSTDKFVDLVYSWQF